MNLHLSPTLHTPEILFQAEKHLLILRGSCFPENSIEFFRPLWEFLKEHKEALTKSPLQIHVELSYINSSSQRELYQFLHDFLQLGGKIQMTIYQGEGEDELEDLRYVVFGLERLPGIEIYHQKGYYEEGSSLSIS
ncbi:MAG: DUF1987 domain-containing protein [Bacteroidia bacterium]|nr:DUF1987 domain-containing protein [Bacteroidia bacterium]